MSNGVNNKAFDLMTTAADKTAVDLFPPEKKEVSTKNIHNALMAAGMSLAYGNIADVADATLYALEGEFGEAGWSLASAIPVIGQMVAGKRALKVAKEAGEEVVTVYRAVGKGGTNVKGGKFTGSPEIKGEIYGTTDINVSKKYQSLGSDRKIMEFEIPKKWILKNEETIKMAEREGDTFMANLRRDFINKGKYSEVRFSEEVGIPVEFLKKVHK